MNNRRDMENGMVVLPSNRYLAARLVLEAVAIFIMTYPMLHIYVILQGDISAYKRGFFCDDLAIKYPLLDNTISIVECFIIWFVIVIVTIPIVEWLHLSLFMTNPPRIGKIPWIFIELYRMYGYFGLGALATLLTTEMAKYKIGRLRPHFLAACIPNFENISCVDENDMPVYVLEFNCTGSPKAENYARKSFLSGHASFSFYSATFLIIYLHARFTGRSNSSPRAIGGLKVSKKILFVLFIGAKILRPFLQFGFFSLAFYICLTRVSDYHHHTGDVVMGAFVGIIFAIITVVLVINLFNRPRVFKMTPEGNLQEGLILSSYPPKPDVDFAERTNQRR
ncbi:phospholipid phosphatase 1 [Lepeophtheirus salmonis]|nr:phospholipid phosphatase 1-like [Lepeophtheirus salmonis]